MDKSPELPNDIGERIGAVVHQLTGRDPLTLCPTTTFEEIARDEASRIMLLSALEKAFGLTGLELFTGVSPHTQIGAMINLIAEIKNA